MVLCHGEEYKFVELLSLSFDASPEEAPLVVVVVKRSRSLSVGLKPAAGCFFSVVVGSCTRLGIFRGTSDIRRVS